jgi:hemolysin activation/secretion protein
VGGGKDGYVKSGNVKLSTTVSGITGPTAWNANGYFLQGFPGITSDKHLHNFDRLGIDVGEARALGGLANLTLLAAPNVSVNLRGAGQVALSSLPSSMGFSLGSDVGLIGLPGSIASGDSGWLAVGELIWSVWKERQATAATHPLYRERGDPCRTLWRDLRRSGGGRRPYCAIHPRSMASGAWLGEHLRNR